MSFLKDELLDGDYEILNSNASDVLVFADFGRNGLQRAAEKIKKLLLHKEISQNVCAYGVLGSVYGIPILIKNVLSFEEVSKVFLIGTEIKPFFSFSALELIHKNGVDKDGSIKEFDKYIYEKYKMCPLINKVIIEKDVLKWFQKYISIVRINTLEEYLSICDNKTSITLKRNNSKRKEISKLMRERNKIENEKRKLFRSRTCDVMVGASVYEHTIEDAHKLAILKVMFSGHEVDSQYGKTKEIINLMITIKNPYPEVFRTPIFLRYGKELVSPTLKSDTYTYGDLLTSYPANFNQIKALIDRLKKNLYDRASLASLWVPPQHLKKEKDQPCLINVHVLIRGDKVNITAYFRSNDIFKAWPLNVAGISYLNYYIWKELSREYKDLKLGYVTTISASAHIYESDWKEALAKGMSYEKDFVPDKFGYFIFSKNDDDYIVKVYENDGRFLGEINNRCPTHLRKMLVRRFALTEEHASYIGETLERIKNNKK